MLKFLVTTFTFLSFLINGAASAQQEKIFVAIDANFAPYSFIDDTGKPQGLIVDYWRLWQQENQRTVDFIALASADELKTLPANSIEVVTGTLVSAIPNTHRQPLFEPFKRDLQLYKVRNYSQQSAEPTIGIAADSLGSALVKSLSQSYRKVITYQSMEDLLQAAQEYDVDAIYADAYRVFCADESHSSYLIEGNEPSDIDNQLYMGVVDTRSGKHINYIGVDAKARQRLFQHYRDLNKVKMLTPEERQWLANNPISVVVSEHWYPYSFKTKQNNIIGYHAQMLELISDNIGAKFDVKTYNNWQSALEQVARGDFDSLMGVTPTVQRNGLFNFSGVYLYRPAEIFTHQSNKDIVTVSDISQRTIAVLAGDALLGYVKKRFPDAKLLFVKNDEEVTAAVLNGKAEAGIMVSESVANNFHNELKVLEQVSVSGGEFAIATTKSNAMVSSIMRKGVDSLTPKQRKTLLDSWLAEPPMHSLFNQQEISFIRQHPTLVIGSRVWPQLVGQNSGSFTGASATVINAIANMTGMQLVLLHDDGNKLTAALTEGHIDLSIAVEFENTIAGATDLMSQHYLSLLLSLYSKEPLSLETLLGDDNITVAVDVPLYQVLGGELTHTPIDWKVISHEQALNQLEEGIVDAILTSPTLISEVHRQSFSHLKQNKVADWPMLNISLRTNASNSTLQSIIQKSLRYIKRPVEGENSQSYLEKVSVIARQEPVPFYMANDIVKGISHDLIQGVLNSADVGIDNYKIADYNVRDEFEVSTQFDVMAMVDIEDDGYFYSDPVIRYSDVVVTRAERNYLIQNLTDLKGKSIIAWHGAYQALGDEYQSMYSPANRPENYREMEDQRQQLELLIANKVDAIVIDQTILRWYINQIDPNILSELSIEHIISKSVPRYVAFKDKSLRDRFNAKLKIFKDSGKYQTVIRRYTQGAIRTQLKLTDLITNMLSKSLKENDRNTTELLSKSFANLDFIEQIIVTDSQGGKYEFGQRTNNAQRQLSNVVFLESKTVEAVGKVGVWFAPRKLSLAMANGYVIPHLSKYRHLKDYSFYQSVYRRLGYAKQSISFTEQELAFIAQSPPIKYTDTNWRPLIFENEGVISGIVVDYLALISRKTGLTFEYVPSSTWEEAKQLFGYGAVELLPSTGDDENTIGLQTKPYAKFNFAVVKRKSSGYIDSIQDIENDRVVAIEGFTPASLIKNQYPHIDIVLAKSATDALSMVSRGEADAFIGHAAVAWHHIVEQFNHLSVVGITENTYAHRMMVQADSQILFGILSKAVADLDYDETALIRNKWIDKQQVAKTDYELIIKIVFGFSLLFLIGYFFTRKLMMKNTLIEKTNQRLSSTIDDLTNMQQALTVKTKALQEQKENFESLFSDATLGSLLIQSGRIVDCNNALIKLLGYQDKNDLLFLSIDDFSPKEQPSGVTSTKQVIQYIKQCLATGTMSFEWLLLTKTKDELWCNVVLTRMKMNNSDVVHVVVSDISDRKSLEQEILNHNLALQSTNKELEKSIADLNAAQRQLIESEKLASLGELVAGVAHEINTPVGIGMTGISHFCSITEDINSRYKQQKMSKKDFEQYLEQADSVANLVLRNLERTAQLVSSFKQVSVDQTSEEMRQFNMREYVEEILISLSNILKHTNLDIQVNCDNNLLIYSYPGSFAQIISNLIINSNIHGYPDKQSGVISIAITLRGNTLSVVYKDDGKGISEKSLPKIFDPFYTTNRENGGSGLGLNIIYNIITSQLSGSIRCESTEGEGVTFFISYPVEPVK
ncbi:MAG: transporter substrate-binding domain-containing protein [Psychrobium sp.]